MNKKLPTKKEIIEELKIIELRLESLANDLNCFTDNHSNIAGELINKASSFIEDARVWLL